MILKLIKKTKSSRILLVSAAANRLRRHCSHLGAVTTAIFPTATKNGRCGGGNQRVPAAAQPKLSSCVQAPRCILRPGAALYFASRHRCIPSKPPQAALRHPRRILRHASAQHHAPRSRVGAPLHQTTPSTSHPFCDVPQAQPLQ